MPNRNFAILILKAILMVTLPFAMIEKKWTVSAFGRVVTGRATLLEESITSGLLLYCAPGVNFAAWLEANWH